MTRACLKKFIQDLWSLVTVAAQDRFYCTRKCCRTAVTNRNSIKRVEVSYYITKYPVLGTAQGALHITSLADWFNQTPSLSGKDLDHAAINVRTLIKRSTTVRYSSIQVSELGQCTVKNLLTV